MSKNWKWFLLVAGILSILAGVYTMANPGLSLASMTLLFAIIFGIHGISEIVHYVKAEEKHGWALVNGIIILILALSLMSGSFIEMVTFIPFIFSFWALSNGITRTMIALKVKKEDKKLGNSLLLWGILGIVAAVIMMAHPVMTGLFVTYTIAMVFIYQGVVSLVQFFKVK
ncbi:TPA: HdeD family acid-resistance protein [Streptococcus suis]